MTRPVDDAHVAQSWQFGPEQYVLLKAAYDEAVAAGVTQFVYASRDLDVNYAKYLLEYLADRLQIQEA